MARKKHDDLGAGPAAGLAAVPARVVDDPSSPREVAPVERGSERAWQASLRPRNFDEYVGQADLIENLRVSVRAARDNGWTLDHFLLAGPPGLPVGCFGSAVVAAAGAGKVLAVVNDFTTGAGGLPLTAAAYNAIGADQGTRKVAASLNFEDMDEGEFSLLWH